MIFGAVFLVHAISPGDVAWVASTTSAVAIMTPVRVENIEGTAAIVRPGPLVLEVDEHGRIRALTPSTFSDERIQIDVADLEPEPPTKTSLRLRAVAEKDPAKKKVLFARALALDPSDAALAREAGEHPAVHEAQVTRADLVYGCRGDLTKAVLVEGEQALFSLAPDACAVRVEMRPPCAPNVDDTGLADDDADALRAAAAEQYEHAKAEHGKRRARMSRYGGFGPGLRLIVKEGGELWVTSSPLSLESCDCDRKTARLLGDESKRIVLPKRTRPAIVYVKVPRYVGALHRIGGGRPADSGVVSFHEPFHPEPDDERSGLEVFSAPEGCECAADCG